MTWHGQKINDLSAFTDKGLREVEAWLEPWMKRLLKGDGLAIKFNTHPQEGPSAGSWVEVTTTGENPTTGDSFDLDTSSGYAFWTAAGFLMESDGSIALDNLQGSGSMSFTTGGFMTQSGKDWRTVVNIDGSWELEMNHSSVFTGSIPYEIKDLDGTWFHLVSDHGHKFAMFGATPVYKQTGVAVTAAGIHAALVNYGMISA